LAEIRNRSAAEAGREAAVEQCQILSEMKETAKALEGTAPPLNPAHRARNRLQPDLEARGEILGGTVGGSG